MIIYYINIKLFKFDNFFILLKIIYLINIYLYFICTNINKINKNKIFLNK